MLDKNNKILIVFTYTYDRLGRVSTLKSGNVTRTMTYDIHGWTTSLKTALSGKTMTEKLYYADSSKPRYNGFVSRRDLDGYSYLYTYNNRGFLTEAKYSGGESGSDYTETFSYNDRGGLLTLKRMGVTDLLPSGSKSFGTLDDISGSYTGNRLTSVTVSTGAQVYDKRTGIRKSGTYSLSYDASGRLTSDGTRGVTSITYDNNGMLTGSKTSDTSIEITRDGLGRKMASAIRRNSTSGMPMPADCRGYTGNGHVVRNSSLEMSRFPGGFFDSAGSPYYYLTDFQGNNIGVYDKTGKLVQRTDYYASGEPWLEPVYGSGASGNRYLFGGKERMAGGALNEYDFEARNYVASFQRFTTIDPETEKFPWMSPYAYCNGNPINFIDQSGLYPKSILYYRQTKLFEADYYVLSKPTSYLLSLVSSVPESYISKTKIMKRGIGHFLPLYDLIYDCGGAITIGANPMAASISLTPNYFEDDKDKYNGNGYGDDIHQWLFILSHEVVHLKHVEEKGNLFSYLFSFIADYTKYGHDKTPREIEANKGSTQYLDFIKYTNSKYGGNSLINLLKSDNNDNKKIEIITLWWNNFKKDSDGKQK